VTLAKIYQTVLPDCGEKMLACRCAALLGTIARVVNAGPCASQGYPWKSPQDDLAAAEKRINDCGYHRRDEELADAKRAILGW